MTTISTIIAASAHKNEVLQCLSDRLDETAQQGRLRPNQVKQSGGVWYDQIISNQNYFIAVALVKGHVVACASVYCLPLVRRAGLIAFVEHVVVKQSLRGQGIGKKLMTYIESECRRRRVQTIKLFSRTEAGKVHRFYQKLGYTTSDLGFHKDLSST